MSVGPLRFSVKGDEVVELGGQVLARLNTECTPSILDEFTLFLESVSEAGATDEIEEFLYPDEEILKSEALTKYDNLRYEINAHVVAGLVPIPIALLFIRKALETSGDDEDTPVTEEHEPEIEWTADDESASVYGIIEPVTGVETFEIEDATVQGGNVPSQ